MKSLVIKQLSGVAVCRYQTTSVVEQSPMCFWAGQYQIVRVEKALSQVSEPS